MLPPISRGHESSGNHENLSLELRFEALRLEGGAAQLRYDAMKLEEEAAKESGFRCIHVYDG